MAYLNPPYTIIDSQSDLHPSLRSIVSAPPAATWFDEDRKHFVALKAASPSKAGSAESTSGSLDSSVLSGVFYSGSSAGYDAAEVVQYQAFGLPDDTDQSSVDPKQEESSFAHNRQSVLDVAKKAAKSARNALVTEILVDFHLPRELAIVQSSDDDNTSTKDDKTPSRRIPILAKFSEKIDGVRFLALQYTPTMLRIINVEHNQSEHTRDNDKHWTIDLSHSTNPVASAPEILHSSRDGKDRGLEIDTVVLGGGVVWCKGTNGTLNLILITTAAVLIYEMNISTKNMRKLRFYPHPPATSFWFESTSRVLIIGSYKSHSRGDSSFPGIVMEMKTVFFTENGAVETLPPFVVGSLRENYVNDLPVEDISDRDVTPKKDEVEEDDIISPSDLSLVCVHGDVYCVELGSLGCGRGIGLIKFDRANRCIHVRQHQSKQLRSEPIRAELTCVGVVDNLLCIFLRGPKYTVFLDIHALFSDDPREFKEVIKLHENDTRIYDGSVSFLAPSFFLRTDGDGLLYELKVDVHALLQAIPPTACIVPFLLRRNEPRHVLLHYIFDRLGALIKLKDSTTLKSWLGVIVEQYSKSEAAIQWDSESTDDLLLPLSLLSDLSHSEQIQIVVPGSCQNVLTQAEVLQFVLLKHAKLAIENPDTEYLELICHLSVQYLIDIERRCYHPCFALHGLVIALLLKQRHASELCSYLRGRETQWTQIRRMRQMNIYCLSQMYSDFPKVAITYAEMLFNTAISCSCERSQKRLISHATTILLGCNANASAVKCLLSAGHLEDAIAVCLKKHRSHKDCTRWEDTIKASDFFYFTVEKARLTESLGDRCKLFYHLHCFLRQMFPTEFIVESRKVNINRRTPTVRRASFTGDGETIVIEQSKLAHECKFPDDLFGGINNLLCMRLRLLFGYSSNMRQDA
eukprot:CCRYP_014092-RA/>CCRYP_014092-RA protein AED:0.05 eAED:0.05 QI:98/1/1/1/0.85/0.75/8/1661/914